MAISLKWYTRDMNNVLNVQLNVKLVSILKIAQNAKGKKIKIFII
jgi:hypothetical protein